MATVRIPLMLAKLTGGVRIAEVGGSTVAEVISALDTLYPGMEDEVQAEGRIKPHVAFTVDGKIALAGLATPVGPQSEVNILPSMGGG